MVAVFFLFRTIIIVETRVIFHKDITMYKNRVKVSLITQNTRHKGVKYMITNRVIGGSFIFSDIEKDYFLRLLFQGQYRHSYHIVDYVLMDNHYHCILEIPEPGLMSREEVFGRW